MLNLLPRLNKYGWEVTKTKLSKLSGTQVVKFWLAAVLRIECAFGNLSSRSHIMFSRTLNAEFTKFNGVVQESVTLCLRLVVKMVG